MSHPDPYGPPDRTPIQIGEVWETPITHEYAKILELPYRNPEGRAVAELLARVGARVAGEHRHPGIVHALPSAVRRAGSAGVTVKRADQTSILRQGESAIIEPGNGTTGGTRATETPACAWK